MSQLLLQPMAVDLEADAYDAALASLPLLEEFGFSCEDFGAGTLLVREIPSDIRPEDAAATLEELAEDLRLGRADVAVKLTRYEIEKMFKRA